MTDFKKNEELLDGVRGPETGNETVNIEADKTVDHDDSGFLDEDLAEDFVLEEAAEAFLKEIGSTDKDAEAVPVKEELPLDADNQVKFDEAETKEEGPVGRSRRRTAVAAVTAKTDKTGRVEKTVKAEKTEKPEPKTLPPSADTGPKGRKPMMIAGAILGILLVVGGVYVGMGYRYNKVFFPNTQINGIDASGKSAAEMEKMIASGIDDYVLQIEERDGKTEQITKENINLRAEFDGSLAKMIGEQEPLKWLVHQMKPSSYEIKTMITYDEDAYQKKLQELDFMNTELMVKPENARISDYVSGQGYSIVPEVLGSTVLPDIAKAGIAEAIKGLHSKVSLEELGAYEAPGVRKEDAYLTALCDTMNKYAKVTVTYKFGDSSETLNGDRIKEWLVINGDSTVSIDSAKVAAYVEELSITHDTYNKAKTLKTSYGSTIKVTGGTYGWKINRAAETEALIGVITAGESVVREPVYSQKAAGYGEKDYGDTYVELNLTAQHLFFYKNGSLLVESDFVSGNMSKGWGTPAGTYPLNYKQRNATLKGEGYRTPVDYWMPFNGGIGLHDAKWRSAFGGAIYKTGGSHGCINLPHGVAQKIYENISAGIPVICYNLSGTESVGSSTKPPAETTAPPAATAPAETQAPPTPTQAPPTPTQAPPTPTQAPPTPTQAPAAPETTAPAGPGSDNSLTSGSGSGPGSIQ